MTAYLRIEIEPCVNISVAAHVAKQLADQLWVGVKFEFNGVECVATPLMTVDKICEAYTSATADRNQA